MSPPNRLAVVRLITLLCYCTNKSFSNTDSSTKFCGNIEDFTRTSTAHDATNTVVTLTFRVVKTCSSAEITRIKVDLLPAFSTMCMFSHGSDSQCISPNQLCSCSASQIYSVTRIVSSLSEKWKITAKLTGGLPVTRTLVISEAVDGISVSKTTVAADTTTETDFNWQTTFVSSYEWNRNESIVKSDGFGHEINIYGINTSTTGGAIVTGYLDPVTILQYSSAGTAFVIVSIVIIVALSKRRSCQHSLSYQDHDRVDKASSHNSIKLGKHRPRGTLAWGNIELGCGLTFMSLGKQPRVYLDRDMLKKYLAAPDTPPAEQKPRQARQLKKMNNQTAAALRKALAPTSDSYEVPVNVINNPRRSSSNESVTFSAYDVVNELQMEPDVDGGKQKTPDNYLHPVVSTVSVASRIASDARQENLHKSFANPRRLKSDFNILENNIAAIAAVYQNRPAHGRNHKLEEKSSELLRAASPSLAKRHPLVKHYLPASFEREDDIKAGYLTPVHIPTSKR